MRRRLELPSEFVFADGKRVSTPEGLATLLEKEPQREAEVLARIADDAPVVERVWLFKHREAKPSGRWCNRQHANVVWMRLVHDELGGLLDRCARIA